MSLLKWWKIKHTFSLNIYIHTYMSDSLWPHDPMDCIWNSQGQKLEWVAFPSAGDLPNPRTEPRSPPLQADFLPAVSQGKPKNTGVGSLSLLQWIFSTQELNWELLHCGQILYQLSYQESPIYSHIHTLILYNLMRENN